MKNIGNISPRDADTILTLLDSEGPISLANTQNDDIPVNAVLFGRNVDGETLIVEDYRRKTEFDTAYTVTTYQGRFAQVVEYDIEGNPLSETYEPADTLKRYAIKLTDFKAIKKELIDQYQVGEINNGVVDFAHNDGYLAVYDNGTTINGHGSNNKYNGVTLTFDNEGQARRWLKTYFTGAKAIIERVDINIDNNDK